jgi:LmbE family N-acetylglucosaminyl deacetylase
MVAARPVADQIVKEVYCFNVPSSTEWNVFNASTMFMPNVVVDIADFADKKYAALAEYKTELREYPHPRSIEHIRKQDESEGLKAGLLSGESFMLIRKVVK